MRFQVGDKVTISKSMKDKHWYGRSRGKRIIDPINEVGEIIYFSYTEMLPIIVKWDNSIANYSEEMLEFFYRRP